MANLVVDGAGSVKLKPGSSLFDIFDRQYYDQEFYEEILKGQGPKFREFKLSEGVHYQYKESTGVITFLGSYGEVRVLYDEPLDVEALRRIVPITKVNSDAKRTRNINTSTSNILESQQENKISNEGTIIGDFKEVEGFKSLYPFAKEGEAISKSIMPVKLTSSVGDGSLSAVATNVSQLTSILGSSPEATGTLKRIVTSGAPASLLKQMQKSLPNLTPQRLRTFASRVSVNPSITIETLKPEKSPSLISVQTASKIYKDKLKLKLNNSAFNLDPFGLVPGLGRSKQNLAAQFVGTLLNKVGSVFGSILNGLKVFGDNAPPSITSAFGGNIKDLIEVGGSQTNISSYVNKGNLVDVKTPKIEYVLQNQNSFLGYATPDDYEFTFVSSTEELIKEFQDCRRGPKCTDDDAIGGLAIYESDDFYGPPEKANAKSMQAIAKKSHLAYLTKEIESTGTQADNKTAAETALDRISIRPNDYALNSHYLILTDGSLQRGRPIDIPRSKVSYPRFNKTVLQLSFVSGGKVPNTKMFETYDRFLKAWFTVFPDCGVYGNGETSVGGGINSFDVRQSVKSKYRFVYRYENLGLLDEFPTKVERVITKPTTIAKTSSTITKPITFAEANQNIKETLESKEFNDDINSAINKAGAALAELNGEEKNAVATKFGAENLQKGDLKAKMDADFKIFQAGMKEKNKQLNSIIGKVNTDNTSVKTFADKLRRR